jgi:hypothetical protein
MALEQAWSATARLAVLAQQCTSALVTFNADANACANSRQFSARVGQLSTRPARSTLTEKTLQYKSDSKPATRTADNQKSDREADNLSCPGQAIVCGGVVLDVQVQ